MTSMDVLWVAIALASLLVGVGLFLVLIELKGLLKESRATVQITNQELPSILTSLRKTLDDLQEAANSVSRVAKGIAEVSDAIGNLSKKAKGGWFGTGLMAGIEFVKNLFRRQKHE